MKNNLIVMFARKTGCAACEVAKKKLEKNRIDFVPIYLEDYPRELDKQKVRGFPTIMKFKVDQVFTSADDLIKKINQG